ncbi:MAG: hypothetical protein C0407_03520 [Desulfobacca sp.]|nr:hypothetical protein [Desulfobacca sp.]
MRGIKKFRLILMMVPSLAKVKPEEYGGPSLHRPDCQERFYLSEYPCYHRNHHPPNLDQNQPQDPQI